MFTSKNKMDIIFIDVMQRSIIMYDYRISILIYTSYKITGITMDVYQEILISSVL